MRRAGKSVVFSLLFCMIVLAGGYAQAAKLILTNAGSGVYIIQGIEMDGVSGVDLTVTYDSSSLSNPTVTQGALISGGLMSYNAGTTGKIRIVAVTSSTYKGSGVVATLAFTRNMKVAAKTPLLTANAIDMNTKSVDISTGYDEGSATQTPQTADNQNDNQNDVTQNDNNNDGTSGTYPATWLSGVTMPSDTAAGNEKKDEVKQVEVPATDALKEPASSEAKDSGDAQEQPAEPKGEKEKAKEPKFFAYKGVLETLNAYTGPRQPKEILDLFGQQSKGYRQEPPVFLADGKGVLKVRLMPPHDAVSAPNVAINKEAQLVSFRRGDENSWVVELRPKKGAYRVVLTYFVDDIITEIPLTVAPLLESYNGKPFAALTEVDFRQFLARGGTPADQKAADLNGDGAVDAVDDYFFAANYLVQTAAAKPAPKEQKGNPAGAAGEQKVQPAKKTR